MTRSPSYHYAAADALLAELAESKPESFKFPFVQAKVQRAQIHALLANSPWHPGIDAEAVEVVDDEGRVVRRDNPLDCRECGGSFDRCISLPPGRKCCPDCRHHLDTRPRIETRTAKGDLL
ncbi:hypothetical protein SEA_JAMIE19_47 [Mycobacterium phage Jamie19]|uniref:Uncharacterized protein n=10 Tax=Charlievirus TaxID=1623280 RepID=A0A1I9SCA4_9CAUD|nr:hypothetical protein [Mycolicibacterium goodii]YP_009017117.1 hypothetical protein CL59_gp53 [Mycobacterium phage Redi]YP_009304242.1 hypothetical protein BJD68_gp50 [Mycobacterium phage Phrann]YP_010051848.1 hypothetical protein KD927_gp47 [Mycobacterium phage Raymond7]YP_010052118.1 hypothetical protein KD931_gp46 [Mycobacterium phage Andies]YP_010052390.1 hypothetical protein KD935_gp47 [Mycobacterium phage Jamie19]AOZ64481.1 hypothetical protein SEA_PHANCYPHIN_53 [Mycobacterium phage P